MKLKTSFRFLIAMSALAPLSLLAALGHAPANFKTRDGMAVFIDFKEASYSMTYDPAKKSVRAVSKISFENSAAGMPLFDLVENPSQILLDGEDVQNKLISTPDSVTKLRMILKNIAPGLHQLEIESPITEGVNFVADGVSSAFWFSDLDDRSYLEAYLPANYEFDQYKMVFNLDFSNLTKQRIYSNGVISKINDSKYSISFPESYTSSSVYFHTAPLGRYPEKIFNFHSIDGRDIPVTAYSADRGADLEILKTKILESLNGLEAQYGAFLHSSVTIFNAGSGGMEYCGATMTDLWALNHELTHSYFARGGFMPSNGNSGWLDEAITSWSDDGSPVKKDLGNMTSNMAGHSQYRRATDTDAYSKGKSFISHLHYKFSASGGMTPFLNHLIETDSFKPMTTEEFIKKISDYYSEDLNPLFKKYVYGKGSLGDERRSGKAPRHVHMKMSIKEMAQFL